MWKFTKFLIYVIFETNFHDTTRLHYFSSHITYFWQKYPIKVQIFRFFTIELKYIKFLMSFFTQKVSLSPKFGSLFSVIRNNFSVLFHVKLYILLTKGTHQVQISRLSTALMKINRILCHFFSHESVFT